MYSVWKHLSLPIHISIRIHTHTYIRTALYTGTHKYQKYKFMYNTVALRTACIRIRVSVYLLYTQIQPHSCPCHGGVHTHAHTVSHRPHVQALGTRLGGLCADTHTHAHPFTCVKLSLSIPTYLYLYTSLSLQNHTDDGIHIYTLIHMYKITCVYLRIHTCILYA